MPINYDVEYPKLAARVIQLERERLRLAICATSDTDDVDQYLPALYKVIGKSPEGNVLIIGRDHHGWTLDGYVIPRLGSALIHCEEIT